MKECMNAKHIKYVKHVEHVEHVEHVKYVEHVEQNQACQACETGQVCMYLPYPWTKVCGRLTNSPSCKYRKIYR